jgi:UDP-N-acetylglucosamine/UDP-N-acetylgalactosamine diphosphorylase
MSSKVLAKRDPYEKLGVIGYQNGKLTVIEYSDLSNEDMEARNSDGQLKFNAGSIAIHCINRTFIENLTNGKLIMPYHRAHKKIPYIDETGKRINPEVPNGYKFEMFIFDALQFTTQSVVMEVERSEEFSPVKNAEGEDSAGTARQALCDLYGNWLEKAGVPVERKNGNVTGRLEISPLFAIDENEFAVKCPKNVHFFDGLYLA